MESPEPTSIAGAIGLIGGAISAGWAFLQTRQNNKREENIIIVTQQARIDGLIIELREEQTRADAFAKERNDLIREFSDVKAELASMKIEMAYMTRNLKNLTEQNAKLLGQTLPTPPGISE
jgi:uncharacterized coiled-coil DUF342 family protein